MRVLLLATKYFGVGGAEAYTRMFADAIAADDVRVEILSFLDGEMSDRTAPGPYLGHAGARSSRGARLRFLLDAVRRGRGYDLVVCSHVAVAQVGQIIHRVFRVPYLVFGHGIDVWGPLDARRRTALRGAARVVAVSRFTGRMLVLEQGVAADRVTVVYPAVDPVLLGEAMDEAVDEAVAPRDGAAATLLTVARLSAQERYKGCDAVIGALPDVIAGAGPVRYVIVGEGDDRPRLEALARQRGVADRVVFAGRVQRDGLAAWYRACDVFVMPSVATRRPDGWTGEGFGIVYLEAAAFRRPVIAGAGGGAPEAVEDAVTGLVVDGADGRAVAAAITRLVRDPAARARMGSAGRQRVLDQFTFDRFRAEAAAVVRGVAGGGAR